jgi:transposase-like protein
MAHRRKFTPEFKAEVVLELLSGAKSGAELCREHQIAASVLADWKAIFLERAGLLFENSEPRHSQASTRVAELLIRS